MSNTARRRKNNTHIPRKKKQDIRILLLEKYGNKCCWCNKEMEIPALGKQVKDLNEMATIEHYFAIKNKDPDNINFLKLSHHKCNK